MPIDLEHFVRAQDPLLEQIRAELRSGCKRTHWMWFVFPQLRGLGSSAMSHRYGLASLAEAQAFLAHPFLEPRFIECVWWVNQAHPRSANEIFGSPDDLKFHSSMTLFARTPSAPSGCKEALRLFFGGQEDPRTLELLSSVVP